MRLIQSPPAGLVVMPGSAAKPAQNAAHAARLPAAAEQPQLPAPAPQPAIAAPETQVPTTKAEYNALIDRKGALSEQLQSAQGRRDRLARQLQSADGVSRSGLETRIQVLDGRLVQLERDIATNSSLIALTPTPLIAGRHGNLNMGNFDATPVAICFTLFVMGPVAVALARNLWRRGNTPQLPKQTSQSDERLERVEQSVDAIAIEIERITEGQRFMTQLLSKQQSAPALGVGQAPAEPIRVPNAEAVPVGADVRRSY